MARSRPGLAVGGALLVGSAYWLTVSVGPTPAAAPFWFVVAGLALLVAAVRVVQGGTHPGPTRGRLSRPRPVSLLAMAGCLTGVEVAIWRMPDGAPGAATGSAWPAALVGFGLSGLGFAFLAMRLDTARGPGRAPEALIAVVVSAALLLATHVAVNRWARERAADTRVDGTPLRTVDVAATPAQRWSVRLRGEVVEGATVPVVWTGAGVEGLDPSTGQRRWWAGYDDRRVVGVGAWRDRVVVRWEVHPTTAAGPVTHLRTLIDAASGRVLAETTRARDTFVGDRVRHLPDGCDEADRVVGSGLLVCGSRVRRIDATGRPLWTADAVPGVVAHEGPDGVLLASYGLGVAAVDPDSGTVRWRSDRRLDDLVGVTDGVVVWRDGSGAGTVRLSGVDLRSGGPLWTRDTGLEPRVPGRAARAAAVAGHGHVDIVHSGARDRPAVTRLSARDGAVTGPVLQLDLRTGRESAPAPAGTLLLLDSGGSDPRLVAVA
ncbi:PQQ-binding-like beta-propeller repeat protein [Virgisporangium ochraceum]|uniref:Uncharacterized protein n=1 Tax=Virgisporangium ochraceum TaxID=65505 RepID=A0A8J4A158_9ACTN|nr:PQQ-binding-like beta-propeller repeat protein [Virgisporangium ochraceum]GIJ73939.1 hypothetical protein Voc01_088560 [Virgisporangium ochraceum]